MATKLYVGNLSYNVDDQSLQDFFAGAGTITSAVVIKDRESGRSKGFGFVEFADDEAGKQAIADLNGKEMDGRALTVSEARPQEDRPRREGGFGGGNGGGYRGGNGGGFNGGGFNRSGGSDRRSNSPRPRY